MNSVAGISLEGITADQIRQYRRAIEIQLARTTFSQYLKFVVTEKSAGEEEPAPDWPYLRELADDFQRGDSLVILKSRQLWVSWLLAAYALWKATFRGGNVLYLSHTQLYSDAQMQRIKSIYEHLPPELKLATVTDNQSQMHFRRGGRIYSLPSTQHAGRGFSASMVIADEAAIHPYAQENYSAYRNAVADGGQLLMISTANGENFFANMFRNAHDGKSDFGWRFLPWNARPDRDQAWYDREQRNFTGLAADFLRENPSTIEEAFTSLAGLVYPGFDRTVHVAYPKVPYEQCMLRVAGLDLGGSPGNPNFVTILGLTREGHVHQYAEYSEPGELSIDEIGGFIHRWNKRAPLMSVECDWDTVVIATLRRQFGLPARRANKERKAGLEITEWLLKNNRLTINPDCYRSIEEFYSYRWRETTDPNSKERYQTSTPVDHHGDGHDSRRYGLQALLRFLRAGATVSSNDGRPLATRAV